MNNYPDVIITSYLKRAYTSLDNGRFSISWVPFTFLWSFMSRWFVNMRQGKPNSYFAYFELVHMSCVLKLIISFFAIYVRNKNASTYSSPRFSILERLVYK